VQAAQAPPPAPAQQLFAPRNQQVQARQLRWSINESAGPAGFSQGFVQNTSDGRVWQTVPLDPAVNFRAVRAIGAEVWAGGANGVLLHSVDYGRHWTQVAVASGARSISGDIVSIDVPGPGTVRVGSSAGEKWTTLDGGAHWTASE
jgi:photosystem II stability/assembly factor-like uncharacterized protein